MCKQNSKEELNKYIKEAEELLKATEKSYTRGNREALEDMVWQAKKALAGNTVPFIRNRGFYKPEENEEIRFALNRYTMAPTYFHQEVFYNYGLKEAIDWYKSIDLTKRSLSELREKASFFFGQAKELLESASYGTFIGCVDEGRANILRKSINDTKAAMNQSEKEELLLSVIELADALQDTRFSKLLRSDVDKDSSLFLTASELFDIKCAIQSDEELKEEFLDIKRAADSRSLLEMKDIYQRVFSAKTDDYNELNKNYNLWSYTDKLANFYPPKNAKFATLSFVLPKEENEEEGLGHVWIDNVEMMSGSGKELLIKNPGFEDGDRTPFHWSTVTKEGAPLFLWEDRIPFCGRDKKSIYLCNPTKQDEGAWTYNETLPITGGEGYTLTFYAKIDGKLKKGLKAVITFTDWQGQNVGEFVYYFNRKAYIKANSLNLNMQCDAILYALTDDINYAKKAKYGILCFLQDFCQGAEHWMVTNKRPDGSDAYGAVQGGRNLAVIANTYSLIKKAGVWDDKEEKQLFDLIDYMLRYMLDLRDRTELTESEVQRGSSNWQTDMCMGTAMMMMVMEEFPHRKNWLYNAHTVLKAQLLCNVNPDGSWPESIRYHHAALEHFASYAKALEVHMGEDWFADTALKEMFTYSLNLQTPPYEYFNGAISTPPFGDHVLSNGKEFAIYGVYLKKMEQIDKNAADRMYATWCLAKRPRKALSGEASVLDKLMVRTKDYKTEPGFCLKLDSTADFPDGGIYVFRKGYGQEKQSFFAIMSSPKKIGHGHYDQGAFIIFKDNVPVVMDSGVEGYFDSSTEWHLCSYSHACMMFAFRGELEEEEGQSINLTAGNFSKKRGWLDVPRDSQVLDISIGKEIESIKILIGHPNGQGTHIREVHWIKEEDIYIIRDSVKDYEGRLLFNLPVASQSSVITGNHVLSYGYYDIVLETVFLTPTIGIRVETGRTAPHLPTKDKVQMLEYIRAEADARHGFLTILHPKNKGDRNLDILKDSNHKYYINCTNGKTIDISNLVS